VAVPPDVVEARLMRLSTPAFLLLAFALPWFLVRPSLAGAGRRSALFRIATAALVVLSLSGLQVKAGERPFSIMFVIDRSDSMTSRASDIVGQLASLVSGMVGYDRAGLVVFGSDALLERELHAPFSVATLSTETSGSGTNLEEALHLARTTLPRDGSGRVVVVSDGHQTIGDATKEAAFAAADGIAIDVVIPRVEATQPLGVIAVAAPATARANEPIPLVVAVEGDAMSEGNLTVERDGITLVQQRVTIGASRRASVTLSDRAADPGVYVYRARITPVAGSSAFTIEDHRDVGAVVSVGGESRILYVSDGAASVDRVLSASGFRLERLALAALPRRAADYARYDGIVLEDIAPHAMAAAQATAIASYVRELGGGLTVLGSARSLEAGLGGDTPLGAVVPVDFRPRSGQRTPSLGLAVVFDKSGSMDDRVGGVRRIEVARQAVQAVVGAVAATDAVGVIAFDAEPTVVVPLQPGHQAHDLATRLAAIQPGGATAMGPAIELARDWLTTASAASLARRHILLVSDGKTSPDDAARMRRAVAGGAVEVSVVALGTDIDRALLSDLATSTGGRAYFPADIRELPTLAAREASRVAGGRTIDASFVPKVAAHPILAGLETRSLPSLGGYVVGALKPLAAPVLTSHLDDPILATGRAGLGKVAVYTADLRTKWSTNLRAWDGFAALITGTIRWTSRSIRDDALYVNLEPATSGMTLTLDARTEARGHLTGLDVRARVRDPRGQIHEIDLREALPGRYETPIMASRIGPHVVTISASSRDGNFAREIVRGFYWSARAELGSSGVNHALLTSLATSTGGQVLADGESPFALARQPAYRDLRPWLAAAALLSFLCELLAPFASDLLRVRRHERDTGDDGREAAA
jgi:Ca-activated chloride channel homolog